MNYFYVKARRVASPDSTVKTWLVIAASPGEAISLVPEDYVAQDVKIGASTYSNLKGVLGWMGATPEGPEVSAGCH